jgi:segregation and condensation protein A
MKEVTVTPRPDDGAGTCQLQLQAFRGPLEVLLHLVRCDEIDVTDIPLLEVARQCDDYLKALAATDLESAGDHLVMASTLAHLKSRRLLPQTDSAQDAATDDTLAGASHPPSLIQGVRRATEQLQEREALMELVYTRPTERVAEYAAEQWIEADLYALLSAFQEIMRRVGGETPAARITRERVSLVERIAWLMEAIGREGHIGFRALFSGLEDRLSCILTFLALLEVMRMRLVRAYQSHHQEDILIVLAAEPTAPQGTIPQDLADA